MGCLAGSFAEELAKLMEHQADPIPQVLKRKRMQKLSGRAPARLILLKA